MLCTRVIHGTHVERAKFSSGSMRRFTVHVKNSSKQPIIVTLLTFWSLSETSSEEEACMKVSDRDRNVNNVRIIGCFDELLI